MPPLSSPALAAQIVIVVADVGKLATALKLERVHIQSPAHFFV